MDFPSIQHGGHTRILNWRPTPKGHPMMALPGWESTGLPSLKLSDIPEFDRRRMTVPILDQDGKGACLPHAFASAMMIARETSGAPYVPLSPWFLYTLIDNGVDKGSNAGDAIAALTKYGICENDKVPYGSVGLTAYPDALMANAARFKLRVDGCVKIAGFEQAVCAAYFDWCVCFDLQAGNGFDADSDGVVPYLGPDTNHEPLAGERYKLIDGQPRLGGRNSWGTTWGDKGFCYWTPEHLDNAQEMYALKFVVDDPQDPEMPPAIP